MRSAVSSRLRVPVVWQTSATCSASPNTSEPRLASAILEPNIGTIRPVNRGVLHLLCEDTRVAYTADVPLSCGLPKWRDSHQLLEHAKSAAIPSAVGEAVQRSRRGFFQHES